MRLQVIELIVTIKDRFMKKILVILFLGLSFLFPTEIWAIHDPLAVDNNKYGIHIIDENDLENAASLVNSSGGDWGYVTLVIREDDRNIEKWQKIMDKMAEFHLIPLLRLATLPDGNIWRKPRLEDVSSWADFLTSLIWPINNRYIILFNEPNHAKEWGNDVSPREYADFISSFSATLKARSPEFFILPAGFDASTSTSNLTMDEQKYWREMISYKPEILEAIDGWTSHSYPNPGFAGNVTDNGRGTLQTFKWEIQMLKSLGLNRNLPIFITETGWPHQEGINFNRNYLTAEQVAKYIETAANTVWKGNTIVAITPFLLNYQSLPFANFSWQMPASNNFYPQFDVYRSLPKMAGKPVREITITPTPNYVLGEATGRSQINAWQKILTLIVNLTQLVYNRK